MDIQLQDTLSAHRPFLVRWFTKLSGDAQTADDLAQETMVEAWTHRDRLTDPSGAAHWLNAIGANVYKRWCRRRGIEGRRFTDLDDEVAADSSEIDLDHEELIRLLDSALELLPPESRALLTARYLENVPPAELARRLGVSESAAAVRLHRGKLQLRKLVDTELTGTGWQTTTIWCMTCGQTHYEGKFNSATGEFIVRCPRCTLPPGLTAWDHHESGDLTVVRGMKSMKPAMYRLMAWNDQQFRSALPTGQATCCDCGKPVQIRREHLDSVRQLLPDLPGAHYVCPHCGHFNSSALSGIGISTAEGIGFYKANPRIHQLPIRQVEHEGRDSLVLSWRSVLNPSSELAVIFAQDTYEILSIKRDDRG